MSRPTVQRGTYTSGIEILKEKKGGSLGHYPLELLAKIRSKWYPQIPNLQKMVERKPATTVVEFEVKNDGSIGKLDTVESAGNSWVDSNAREAISSSAPFAHFPDAYTEKSIKLRVHFGYDQPVSAGAPFCDGPNWGAHPDSTPVRRVGSGVQPPRTISAPDPEFSEEARREKYMSVVLVAGTVDTEGSFTDLCVTQAAGAGLDEQSIQMLHTWKFEPAISEGKPVPVRIVVETEFLLY